MALSLTDVEKNKTSTESKKTSKKAPRKGISEKGSAKPWATHISMPMESPKEESHLEKDPRLTATKHSAQECQYHSAKGRSSEELIVEIVDLATELGDRLWQETKRRSPLVRKADNMRRWAQSIEISPRLKVPVPRILMKKQR